MRLDSGVVLIYRSRLSSLPGEETAYEWTPYWASYFGEKTVGVNRYYTAKAQNDQTDLLIEVQSVRSLSTATDRAAIAGAYFGEPETERVYFRITQIQQITNDDGLPATELALERVEGLE